ncbi:hypothetical protein SRB5_38920 [Streptomyces sp. RB5]|uniref:Uncharacterized protein n=1 Tax=Streptomyces smaragdinus TaxID=2585196 RepID=A0A7K0CJS2_9ACTN|nr:hypothetical protein [Streptomyces smaragdinus]MQY13740.1 hypothetical protein [Streptomyces smaragdinus]
MTSRDNETADLREAALPHYQVILDSTDWASLETPSGMGASLPKALARLVDHDPAVRKAAIADVIGVIEHQNTIYGVTAPVATYVAAILSHPATESGDYFENGEEAQHYPTRAALLEWLGSAAYEAADEVVAIGERHWNGEFLADYPAMRAFRDLRPLLHSAVHPLLSHHHAAVREEALMAAIPLVEHPALTSHQDELAGHAHVWLSTGSHIGKRAFVLEALKAWGHDTTAFENADDLAERERCARLEAERSGDPWGSLGCSEIPSF